MLRPEEILTPKSIRLFWTFALILFIISIASGAGIQNSFSAKGDGAISRNLYQSWDSGVLGITIGGDSSSRVLTSSGPFKYQTRDLTDARVNNRYNESGYLRAEGTAIFSESVSMRESDLGQDLQVTHSGIINNVELDTAKYVSDANVSIGQTGGWEGSGMYSRDLNYGVDISQSSEMDVYNLGTPTLDYSAHGREHSTVLTNTTGGVEIVAELSYIDFSDSFVVNTTKVVNQTGNTTVNESQTNIPEET